VSDDDAGSVNEESVESALEQALGGGIEARGGLVQQHDAGVPEVDAGEGEELRLAGGEACGVAARRPRVRTIPAALLSNTTPGGQVRVKTLRELPQPGAKTELL